MSPSVTRVRAPSQTGRLDFGYPWIADQGDGTYLNPVLYADYSDPDVIRVGEDFYLTASSFNCTPGLPVLHSRDLVNWRILGHALENLPDRRYEQFHAGCGVWAPSIRFHAGKFWIFFPTPDEGIYWTTAENPRGPWSAPHLLLAGRGLIDPCPLWDGDGQAYLVHAYAGSRAGIKHRLQVRPMTPDCRRMLGEGQVVYHQPEKNPTIEGPKFYQRNGWYYLLAPAGGVEKGWQVALRARNVFGPYEERIVLAQGATPINGPHQGALVDTADGGWWFLHFQDAGVYGRIAHLQPVRWENDWPVIGANGSPVDRSHKPVACPAGPQAPASSDEFESRELGLQWQWNANHDTQWYSLSARPGWLRLSARPREVPLNQLPNLLLQKFPARSFAVETCLDLDSLGKFTEAGLVVAGSSHAALTVARTGAGCQIRLQRDASQTVIPHTTAGIIQLQVAVQPGGTCRFGFAANGATTFLREKFLARPGVWIGAKVGLYAAQLGATGLGGHADFDYFRFKPHSPALDGAAP